MRLTPRHVLASLLLVLAGITQAQSPVDAPTQLQAQLARIKTPEGAWRFEAFDPVAREWTEALRHAIERGAIKAGMPVAEVIALLGPPTGGRGDAGQRRDFWYFDTPRHVNPYFELRSRDGLVQSWSLGNR